MNKIIIPIFLIAGILRVYGIEMEYAVDVYNILTGDNSIYEKYLPLESYIEFNSLAKAVLYAEQTGDSTLKNNIIAASYEKIMGLIAAILQNAAIRIIQTDFKLKELHPYIHIKPEIEVLDNDYNRYKSDINSFLRELDYTFNQINLFYSELVMNKQFTFPVEPPEKAVQQAVQEEAPKEVRVEVQAAIPKEETLKSEYVVKKGDYLVKIAEDKSVFGDYRKWRLIYENNKNLLPDPENPDLIYPGIRLYIPAVDR